MKTITDMNNNMENDGVKRLFFMGIDISPIQFFIDIPGQINDFCPIKLAEDFPAVLPKTEPDINPDPPG